MVYDGSVYRLCEMVQFTDGVEWFSLQMMCGGSVYRWSMMVGCTDDVW